MTLSKEHCALIKHALLHLEANKIIDDNCTHSAWYCGNKKQFKNMHVKSIALLKEWIAQTATGTATNGKE